MILTDCVAVMNLCVKVGWMQNCKDWQFILLKGDFILQSSLTRRISCLYVSRERTKQKRCLPWITPDASLIQIYAFQNVPLYMTRLQTATSRHD